MIEQNEYGIIKVGTIKDLTFALMGMAEILNADISVKQIKGETVTIIDFSKDGGPNFANIKLYPGKLDTLIELLTKK